MFQNLEEIQVTGTLKSYRVKSSKTVADLLKELHLESKFFAVLANGKKVNLTDVITEGSDLTILPKIAGGF
jgi:sulfur carrier protein ThiS